MAYSSRIDSVYGSIKYLSSVGSVQSTLLGAEGCMKPMCHPGALMQQHGQEGPGVSKWGRDVGHGRPEEAPGQHLLCAVLRQSSFN